eukprot:7380255-Prymnesium_polylepis.3
MQRLPLHWAGPSSETASIRHNILGAGVLLQDPGARDICAPLRAVLELSLGQSVPARRCHVAMVVLVVQECAAPRMLFAQQRTLVQLLVYSGTCRPRKARSVEDDVVRARIVLHDPDLHSIRLRHHLLRAFLDALQIGVEPRRVLRCQLRTLPLQRQGVVEGLHHQEAGLAPIAGLANGSRSSILAPSCRFVQGECSQYLAKRGIAAVASVHAQHMSDRHATCERHDRRRIAHILPWRRAVLRAKHLNASNWPHGLQCCLLIERTDLIGPRHVRMAPPFRDERADFAALIVQDEEARVGWRIGLKGRIVRKPSERRRGQWRRILLQLRAAGKRDAPWARMYRKPWRRVLIEF